MEGSGTRVLVTGSDGFIGSHLVKTLGEIGNKVVALDVKNNLDITDWDTIKDFEEIDVICHLAAITYLPFALENPRITYKINILGTLNMLELARKINARRFIFASSYVYGDPKYLPIDEDHPVNPKEPYTHSKFIGEQLCKSYNYHFGLPIIILRPFNIYGLGQDDRFLIPQILKQLKTGRIQLRDPKPKRDFLYIDDMVNAYVCATNYDDDSNFEIFNIGSGESHSVKDIADKIVEYYRIHCERAVESHYTNEIRKNEIGDVVANIEKAEKKLKWKPKIMIDEGLQLIIKSIK